MYSALVFDLDGTLLDSTGKYEATFTLQDGGPKLFKGAYEALEKLDSQGYIICLATSMCRESLDMTLKHFKIEKFFYATAAGSEFKSKPDIAMLTYLYNKIADFLKRDNDILLKSDMLMIGDSSSDIDMATAFGIDSVQVYTGIYTRDWKKPPKDIIRNISNLPQWFEENTR